MVPDFTSAAEPRAYAIYEHYGFAHQVLKLAEDASELADVIVLAVQLCVDMPFEEGVREAYITKLNRQIARIRVEKETYREPQKALSAARSVAAEGISDASARIYEGAAR